MKTLELNLNKRLLIVEVEVLELGKLMLSNEFFPNMEKELISKGSELSEEILKPFIETKVYGSEPFFCTLDYTRKGINKDGFNPGFCIPNGKQFITSFISAIEAKGYHWSENPHKKELDKCNEYTDMFTIAKRTRSFEEAESRTFNPKKTLIFEIL